MSLYISGIFILSDFSNTSLIAAENSALPITPFIVSNASHRSSFSEAAVRASSLFSASLVSNVVRVSMACSMSMSRSLTHDGSAG